MTFLALDGRFVNQKVAYLPPGYHCVMCLDGHPDIISCHPEYFREQFIAGVHEGLEVFTDEATALRMTNQMRHGTMTILASQVIAFMIDANEEIWFAQLEARNVRRKES